MKKALILLVVLSMFTTQTAFSSYFQDSSEKNIEIEYLAEGDVVQGRSTGLYEPDALVNRAEMLKILLEAKDISPDLSTYKNCFPDVKEEWFAPYVCYAKEKGIIQGYEDGNFKPGNFVNLAEALKMANYNFEIDYDIDGEHWYSSVFNGSKAYKITENLDPSSLVTRKEMAEIAVRSMLVSLTSQSYSPRSLIYLRNNQIKVKDASKMSNLPLDKSETASWIVKIKSGDASKFEITYPHHEDSFILTEDSEEFIAPPTIHIHDKNGVAELGLNADFEYDAKASTEDKVFKADVDLSGFYGKSINLVFSPGETVKIYSDLGKKSLTINLETGQITGDKELSQGQTSISNQDFSVCVNDGGDYYGEVRVLKDRKTVLISECSYKISTETKKPIIISMYPPLLPPVKEGKRKLLPPNPKKPNAPANTTPPGEGLELEEEPFEPQEPAPVTTEDKAGDGAEEGEPFPEPENHPGDYERVTTNIAKLEAFIEREEQRSEDREKIFNENKEVLAKAIEAIEDMMEEYGVDSPDVPTYDPSNCCPTAKKDGKCCSDLDLSKAEDRATYKKRMQCLINEFNETQEELQEKLDSVNTLSGEIQSLKMAEDNLGQLAAFLKIHKVGMHILIDVATGGGDFMEAFLDNAIGDIFGDDAEKLYNAAKDPSGVAQNALLDEVFDYKNKVRQVAERLAGKMKLEGAQKDALVENLVDKFGGNASDLANPSAWLKALNDAMVDVGGAAAESFLNTVQKMRDKRNEDLKEAFKLAHLLSQMNDFMNKVATEDCGKKYLTEIKKKLEDDKKKRAENKARFKADAKYLQDALSWILDNYFDELTSDNPSPEVLKERLLKKLKEKLCLYGYDLCWVEISFEVEYTKTEDGYSWKIKKFTIKKLDKKKKGDCECEDIFGDAASENKESDDSKTSGDDKASSSLADESESDSSNTSPTTSDEDTCTSCHQINEINLSEFNTYMFEASEYSLGEDSAYECNDVLVEREITEDIFFPEDDKNIQTQELLTRLFAEKEYLLEGDTLLNPIANSDLIFTHTEIDEAAKSADIFIDGNIIQTHPCDFTRVNAQITTTLDQIFPDYELRIFINNDPSESLYMD